MNQRGLRNTVEDHIHRHNLHGSAPEITVHGQRVTVHCRGAGSRTDYLTQWARSLGTNQVDATPNGRAYQLSCHGHARHVNVAVYADPFGEESELLTAMAITGVLELDQLARFTRYPGAAA